MMSEQFADLLYELRTIFSVQIYSWILDTKLNGLVVTFLKLVAAGHMLWSHGSQIPTRDPVLYSLAPIVPVHHKSIFGIP